MNKLLTYLLLLLFCITTNRLQAQNSQLRAYTIEDGLPQSQVYDIIQDDIGYLWLGTQGGGLASFDGATFKVWNVGNGLLSNYIHSFYSNKDSLFIGTNKGLSIKIKERFLNFTTPQINQFYTSKNKLYIATKQGIYLYSKGKKAQKITLNPGIDSNSINAILFDGTFYWIATNKGLWKVSALKTSANYIQKIEENNFTSLITYKDKIFAATFNDGVFIINTKNEEDTILMREPLRINTMAIHNKNELWVATDNDGITVINADSYSEIKRLNTKKGLTVPHIRKTITDQQSNIWIATSGGGFYKYFQNNFKHYDKDSGLKGNRIYAVHKVKNNIWLSSSEAGLTKIDSLGIHHIPSINSFSNVKIKTIANDKKGNIWAGSDGKGVLYRETIKVDSIITTVLDSVTTKTDTISRLVTKNHVFNSENGFPFDWIRKIIVSDNYIWAATYSSGIVQFNYQNDSIIIHKVFGKNDGVKDLFIKDITIDKQGSLWYATKNGDLGTIKDASVSHITSPLDTQTAIGSLLFYKDKLFLGTAGKGIWYTNTTEEQLNFKRLKGEKKLYSRNIYQLIFDNQGYLWAGSERGVDKIQLNQENEIIDLYHFGRNDGFLGIETCLNAVEKDTNGNLWFGAIYGLTQYIPSKKNKASLKPKIAFTAIKEAYKNIDSIQLNHWTNSDKILQLTPKQTQLSFTYRTIDIDHPNDIEYRSKLNNTEWSPWVKENKQNFAGLAYGAHSFYVQSRNHRWEESNPIQFKFFIDSPLYKKTWFQWAFIALSILLLLGICLYYIRKIKLKNKATQERLQMQNHLLTLEQKALRLQMNPHFIFNVLNGIKAMASGKPEKMNTTINSFATLLRETLYNSRKEHINLDQEIKTLRHYIEVEQLMAPKPFTYHIKTDTDPSAEEILIAPMLIQPFVENAIRHGILKGDKEGELQILFYTTAEYLYCKVIDNGMGIFKSQHAKAKTDHQSMALTVTKERLASISGEDALHISEIKEEDGTINGTNITFKIPLLTDY